MHLAEVDGPKAGGVISWSLENDLTLVFYMPSVVCKDCGAVVITEFGDGE